MFILNAVKYSLGILSVLFGLFAIRASKVLCKTVKVCICWQNIKK